MAKSKKMNDKEAILQLVNTYTQRRDWFMVERLFNDLGRIMEEEETAA